MPKRSDMIAGADIELDYPVRVVSSAPAMEHVPFAMWIIGAHQPRIVVELCVIADNTYCGFLQSIRTLNLEAKCFGFSLELSGEGQSARIGDFDALSAYHDPLYGAFSTLRRAGIADALHSVTDRNIDLLEISGPLTGDGPFEGLDAWLPKMSSRGVILIHGIEAQQQHPKIHGFWKTLSSRHPHFAFTHSQGLGVAYVGSEPLSGALQALLNAREPHDTAGIRSYFSRLGTSVAERSALRDAEAKLAELSAFAGTEPHTAAPSLQKAAAQRDVLTRIVRQQSLTVIQLERELNNPLTRSPLFRVTRFLFRSLVPLSARRYIRRRLPLEKMSRLARNAPAGLKRHIPLSLKQFLARQLSSG
jgi:hypothetical protein